MNKHLFKAIGIGLGIIGGIVSALSEIPDLSDAVKDAKNDGTQESEN